jgi:ABC-2 type transport system ATP-binding protein
MPMSRSAIEVVDLVKVYPGRNGEAVRALDGLSFTVEPGTIFGLLGPNGAGKTTTLRILTTLTRPTSGQALVAGVDVVERPLEARRHLAAVIQESAADLFLTVRDNLRTYGRFRGLSRAEIETRADRVLADFGLSKEAGRKVMDLSGGYRRRVQVAKAFVVETPVLFLDEFSTGMDPILKREVMAALRAQARRGRAIVLTTHILSEAEALCDDILIVNRGRQVARGDLHALKLLSRGVYEVALTLDHVPDGLEQELRARQPLRLAVNGTTVEIALKEDEARVLELVADLARRAQVLRVEIRGADLEDIFVEVTQEKHA